MGHFLSTIKNPLLIAGFGLLALFSLKPTLIAGAMVPLKGGPLLAGDFSGPLKGVPMPWKPLNFPGVRRHTTYSVVEDRDSACLHAESSASASALYREIDLDPAMYPVISWRWKIGGVLEKGDARRKSGDDYAARVYVTFARDPAMETVLERGEALIAGKVFGQSPPGSAINYIWANRLEKGAILPNTYAARDMMIAVESGNSLAHEWVNEEQNIYKDYIKAFGRRPPRVTGIAVMTDSDNTGGRATACYGNIAFKKGPVE